MIELLTAKLGNVYINLAAVDPSMTNAKNALARSNVGNYYISIRLMGEMFSLNWG